MKLLKTAVLSRRTRFFFSVCLLYFVGATVCVDAKIVFCVDNDIFVMNDDGSRRRRLTQSTQVLDLNPRWSPDGTQIAFTRIMDKTQDQTSGEVFIMNADGTGLQRLTDNSVDDGDPSWSPDGQRIVFTSGRSGSWELFVIDLSTLAVTQITGLEGESDSVSPDWSPDGTQIVFERFIRANNGISPKTIYVMSADGQHQRPLLPDPLLDGRLTLRYFPRWSADGQQVLFSEVEWREGGDVEKVVVQKIGGRKKELTAINSRLGNNWLGTSASWMENDRAILTSLKLIDKPGANYDLYRYTFATRSLRQLTRAPSDEEWPDWTAGALSVLPHGKVSTQWGEIKHSVEEAR